MSGKALVEAVTAAFELAGLPLVLTQASGKVVASNPTAVPDLQASQLEIRDGWLTAGSDLDSRRLRDAIKAAAASGVARSIGIGGGRGAARVAYLRQLGLVMVTASATAPLEEPAERIALTAAEIRLLRALVAGERLGAFAAGAGVKLTTVKTHLQNLFDKIGERRQADLVRRALSDPRLKELIA